MAEEERYKQIVVSSDLHSRFKAFAAINGKNMKFLAERYIEEGMKNDKEKEKEIDKTKKNKKNKE